MSTPTATDSCTVLPDHSGRYNKEVMDQSRSSRPVKGSSRALVSGQKPVSSKSSLSSTWSSTNPSARTKSPSSRTPSPHPSPKPAHTNPPFTHTLDRMKTYEAKSHFAFERSKQFLEQQQALDSLPPPPNPFSRKLAQGIPSLQHRYTEVLSAKERKLDAMRLEVGRREREKEEKERGNTHSIASSGRRSISPDRFYDYTTQWSKTVNDKRAALRDQIAEKELSQATFSPKINPSKPSPRPRGALQERMESILTAKERKRREVERTLTPTFTPATNVGRGKKEGDRKSWRALQSMLSEFGVGMKTESH